MRALIGSAMRVSAGVLASLILLGGAPANADSITLTGSDSDRYGTYGIGVFDLPSDLESPLVVINGAVVTASFMGASPSSYEFQNQIISRIGNTLDEVWTSHFLGAANGGSVTVGGQTITGYQELYAGTPQLVDVRNKVGLFGPYREFHYNQYTGGVPAAYSVTTILSAAALTELTTSGFLSYDSRVISGLGGYVGTTLTIDYTLTPPPEPTTVPEPSALSVLALAGLGALAGRRRVKGATA